MSITATYDLRLVTLSVLIAICASFAALDLTGRIVSSRHKARLFWLLGGAAAMGIGIWSMHYIGMLAMQMPIPVFYDIFTVALSMIAAVAASFVALFTVTRRQMDALQTTVGGTVMGLGIATMHYIGMAAMRTGARVNYNLSLVVLSVLLAVGISIIALILAFQIREEKSTSGRKITSALIMGSAIPIMHYTGMFAATFSASETPVDLSGCVTVSNLGVIVISTSTFLVLALVIIGAFLDRLISAQKHLTEKAEGKLRHNIQALVESEERLRLVTENARVGLAIVDPHRTYCYANNAYAQIFDLPSSEIVDRRLSDVLPDVYEELIRPQLDRAFAGERVTYESSKPSTTGDRHYEVRYEPTTAEGSVSAVVIVVTDLTTHKKAELASSRLAAIVESSEDAIVGKDINGIITSWNKGAEKIFGYSASEIVGTSIIRLIPADRRDEEEHILGQIRAGRSVRDFETVRQTQDGQLIDVSVTASPILNATGKTIGISKVARDITERRQAEKKLQKSEDMFGKAFRNSPLAISITTEKEGRYVDINEAFLRTFGYERQEVIGRTSSELGFFWPDAEKRNEMFRHLAKDGRLTGFRLQGQTSKQETLQLEVFAELIDLEEDRCLLAITRDITESLRLETQSRQVQKMDAVGLLAGGVAHDFNNLLGVIMGYSDLVLEASPRDDLRYRQVQQIRKASERAISLTRQLLAFSRKQIFQPKILDINALVTEFSKMLRRMVDENVELVSCLDRSLGHIKADPGQIEQVIMNLVVNARDAMPSGGRVTIETSNAYLDDTYCQAHPVAQPGRYVVVAVSDTGMGMNDKTQARIFEPFFTTKEQGKGTGLGLATVYGVVKQSGGYVWVYSELGKGTTFKMYFPRVDGLSEPSETSNDGKNKIKRGSETILLVEDADLLRTLTCTLLENNGYIVFVAVNGVDAIKLSESEARTIHLLLTDVVMPGMSGPELANYLTAKRPDLRVIYMSGYTNDTITNQGVLDPGINFIEKPFSQEALMSEVRAVLDRPEKVVA